MSDGKIRDSGKALTGGVFFGVLAIGMLELIGVIDVFSVWSYLLFVWAIGICLWAVGQLL